MSSPLSKAGVKFRRMDSGTTAKRPHDVKIEERNIVRTKFRVQKRSTSHPQSMWEERACHDLRFNFLCTHLPYSGRARQFHKAAENVPKEETHPPMRRTFVVTPHVHADERDWEGKKNLGRTAPFVVPS